MDSEGDFVVDWLTGAETFSGYELGIVYAQRYQLSPSGSTMTINGTSASNNVAITFTDATDFSVTLNGGTPTSYSTTTVGQFVYNAPSGSFSELGVRRPSSAFTATQSFGSTMLKSGSFWFDS